MIMIVIKALTYKQLLHVASAQSAADVKSLVSVRAIYHIYKMIKCFMYKFLKWFNFDPQKH